MKFIIMITVIFADETGRSNIKTMVIELCKKRRMRENVRGSKKIFIHFPRCVIWCCDVRGNNFQSNQIFLKFSTVFDLKKTWFLNLSFDPRVTKFTNRQIHKRIEGKRLLAKTIVFPFCYRWEWNACVHIGWYSVGSVGNVNIKQI